MARVGSTGGRDEVGGPGRGPWYAGWFGMEPNGAPLEAAKEPPKRTTIHPGTIQRTAHPAHGPGPNSKKGLAWQDRGRSLAFQVRCGFAGTSQSPAQLPGQEGFWNPTAPGLATVLSVGCRVPCSPMPPDVASPGIGWDRRPHMTLLGSWLLPGQRLARGWHLPCQWHSVPCCSLWTACSRPVACCVQPINRARNAMTNDMRPLAVFSVHIQLYS